MSNVENNLLLDLLRNSSRYVTYLETTKELNSVDNYRDVIIKYQNKNYFLPAETVMAFKAIKEKDEFIKNLKKVEFFDRLEDLKNQYPSSNQMKSSEYQYICFKQNDDFKLIDTQKQLVAFDEIFDMKTKLDNLDALNATLAHDIRSSMGVISISCDYLLTIDNDEQTEDDYKDFLRRIKKQATKGLKLVNSLLDVFKTNHVKKLSKVNLNLAKFLDQVAKDTAILANENQMNIVINSPEIEIFADSDRLTQVIENLIINAIKFSEKGKNIYLETRVEGDFTVIDVRDEGIGIPKKMLDQVFSKYKQLDHVSSKKLGAGLGLSIAQQFIELHGGHITVESEESVGTIFSIKLPHSKPSLKEGKTIILVVDDDDDIREYVEEIIEDHGYGYILASSGAEAIREFKEHSPHVVISDIKMPNMDGFELVERIRNINPTTGFVLASGFYPNITHDMANEVFNVSTFLSKPFGEKELLSAIDEALEKAGTTEVEGTLSFHETEKEPLKHAVGFTKFKK